MVSEIVIQEAADGHSQAASDRLAALKSLNVGDPSDKSKTLGRALVRRLAVLHLAIAEVNGIGYLAPWNLKHIANLGNALRFVQVRRDAGSRPTVISAPKPQMESMHEDNVD